MKIKASNLLILLAILYLIASIHVISEMPLVNSLIRVFRLLTVPFLIFAIFALLPRQSLRKVKGLFPLLVPPIILLSINLLQLFALPQEVLQTHITGSVKFTAWFLLYFAMLSALNETSADKIKTRIYAALVIVFAVGILQYPNIILQAGGSLGNALSNYGQLGERYQLAGIFGSANEDANGFITLFPLALLWIEQQKGLKKKFLRSLLLIYFPLILVFNGTRTALLISLPMVTTLFYWKLSLEKVLYILGPIAGIFAGILTLSNNLISRFFEQESQGGGSFGWRVEHAWAPAVKYTLENSPVFGFGSRGWEFICHTLAILSPVDGSIVPAHSGYVWSLAAWGGLGFIAYVTFLLILLIESFSISKSAEKQISDFGRALFCSVVGYCMWAFISNVMWSQGWIILILLAVLIATLKVIKLNSEGQSSGPFLLEKIQDRCTLMT